jgi:hypothetical protein
MKQLTINITAEARDALQKRANEKGQKIEDLVEQMVNQEALRPSIHSMLAPVRLQIADSGISEDDLDEFLNGVRDEVWQEKHGSRGCP